MSDVDLDAHRICNADHGRVACYCSALDWMTLDQYGEHVEAIAAERVRVAEAAVARVRECEQFYHWGADDPDRYRQGFAAGLAKAVSALTTPTPCEWCDVLGGHANGCRLGLGPDEGGAS